MRMAIALITLSDLCIRASDLSAFYSDSGLWPEALIQTFGWNKGYWSIHTLSDNVFYLPLLFTLHFIFAFSLLIGFKTRLSTLIVWLLYISLHNRNIYILQGGDDLLRLTLFWGLFLPWGSCYSFDSKKTTSPPKQNTGANLAYLILLASVYFFSALLKTSDDWLKNFDAVYFALSLEQIRLPFGDLLIHYPTLLKLLTVLVYGIELLVPLLILWPQKKGNLRLIAFVLLCVLHLGIGLNLFVGLFFMIGIASALALLPSILLDKLETKFKKRSSFTQIAEQVTPTSKFRILKVFFFGVIIYLCLMLNIGSLPYNPYHLRSELMYPVNLLRLNQNWSMFAPGVLRKDGWFVFYGRDSIGRQWDLRLDQDYVDFNKPAHIVSMYKNDRWRKLAENMQNNNYTFLRPLYCKYMLKQWNLRHPEKKLVSLDLYFMEKTNLANYKQTAPFKKLYCSCYVN